MLKSPMSKINWCYQFQQYSAALVAAMAPFVVLSVYLFYRRGYYDLYIANKIIAGVSAILLGVVLLIGSLSRHFSFPDRFVQYRKELGIVVFLLALTHGMVSFFFLPSKFPLSGFFGTLYWPFVFGLTVTIVLGILFFISNNRVMSVLGGQQWWRLQYWGVRFAFTLVLLHVFVMKWNGWVTWYKKGGSSDLVHPEWPGAGLLVGWFMIFVIFVRLVEFASPKLGRITWYVSAIALSGIYIATFWWGRQLAD